MREYINKLNAEKDGCSCLEDITVYKRVLVRENGDITNSGLDRERKYIYKVNEIMTAVNYEGKEKVIFSKEVVPNLCLLHRGGLFSCYKDKKEVTRLCSLVNSDDIYNKKTKKNNKGEEIKNTNYGVAKIAECIIPASSKFWNFENGEIGAQKLKILRILE